jgi:hypothetical protein
VNPPPRPEAADNPFSTCRTRPGAIPYRFPPGLSAATLLERLRANGWRGQIIGAHGTGKSAFLATLLPAIEQSGHPALLVELHDGARRLPLDLGRAGLAPGSVLVVDGYEQLGFWSRWSLRRFCRRQGLGLLVTAHRPVGLPDLFHTATTPELAQALARHLLGPRHDLIRPEEVLRQFELRGGDLRDVWFDLYDCCERRKPADG